jgi:cell division protein FtsQ
MLRRLTLPARVVLVAVAVAATLGGGWMWLRDSSLVRVEEVRILGLSSSEEKAIRNALRTAALDMTTLHLRTDQLRTAVSPFPSVADLRVQTDFPHTLTIEVIERRPVAAVDIRGTRIPVGAGGLVMRGMRAERSLPTLRASTLGAGSRITDRRALAAVAVLAAAPERLRTRVDRAWFGPRGLVLDLRAGPDLVFGDRTTPRAKWAAAARVLAEPSAAGAVYLDVRVPERVAAGGLGPVRDPAPEADPQPQLENSPTLNP